MSAIKRPPINLAVILPELYRGGSGTLRGAVNITRMLVIGANKCGDSIELSFAHVDSPGVYQESDFEELREIGVKIRPFRRETVRAKKLRPIFERFGIGKPVDLEDVYWNFNDGISNFEECDFWIIISDRIQHPIPPHRPYAVVVYDYIQRYVPEIFGMTPASAGKWKMFDAFAKATRAAQFVICTTDQTRLDCINYSGVYAPRVFKFPMEFDPLESSGLTEDNDEPSSPYILWTTNSTPHKNHLNVISGLEMYFCKNPSSKLKVHMSGVYTHLFTETGRVDKHYSDDYPVRVRDAIANASELQKRLRILGNLSDAAYLRELRNARGVLHGALYDNGTYAIVEAAWWGIPSISSDYPAIREACEIFALKPVLFNPRLPGDLARAINDFETGYEKLVNTLPSMERLQSRTFPVVAEQYWLNFRHALESTEDHKYE